MHKKLKGFNKNAGFTGIQIAIFLAFMAVVSGVAIYADNYEVGRPFNEIMEKGLSNPFPLRPSPTPGPTPIEINNNPYIDGGDPIINKYSATGEWHGRYQVTAPSACKGMDGGWEANLKDTDGEITGHFSADSGDSGPVIGRSIGGDANWTVKSGSGLKFGGGISGNWISGKFSNGTPCYLSSREEPVSGDFDGGRTVEQ